MNFKLTWFICIHGSEKTNKCDICGNFSISSGGSTSTKAYMKNPPYHANMSKVANEGRKFENNVADTENDEEDVEEDQSTMDDELQNNFCSICEIRFRTQGKLITHMRN